MRLMTQILIYLYALSMLIGALTSGIMGELSLPLMVVNLGFTLLLCLTHFNRWFFWSGIVGLLVCALLNGLALNGQITLTYFIGRLLFTLAISALYVRFIQQPAQKND